jgi:tRNA(fMet)-specific endonuclease VapC
LCISAITRAELRYGIARRTEATRLTDLVEGFLAIARCEAWDTRAADARGSLRARLADRGTRIGDFDEMIAAHALALDAILVTDNTRHFAHVEGLTVENWRRAC